mgnify:CR=1 FL=1
MAQTELFAIIEGVPAGVLRQDSTGQISFRYADGYKGTPLSLSLPVTNREYGQAVVRPYLFGLLPDSEEQRKAIASEYGGRPNNPVAMLAHMGLDCPGAVQFCHADEHSLTEAILRQGTYEPISCEAIAQRLRGLRDHADDSWLADGEHWSLGGNQGKFALAKRGDQWCSCQGSAATTHIFKNGVLGYKLQALNEFVCMRTAASCGISTAVVSYELFEDEPALVVSRYDRVEKGGVVKRLHFEDVCQALSVMPSMKYASDGGPTTSDVQNLLAKTGDEAGRNLRIFTEQLFYNCLIGAPDAHAKNYSLGLGPDGLAKLAPMYDVASALAYQGMERAGRLAMAIGGENRFGRVGEGAIRRYVKARGKKVAETLVSNGLTVDWCLKCMTQLAQRIPLAMEQVFEDEALLPGMDELRAHLLEPVRRNCNRTLDLL